MAKNSAEQASSGGMATVLMIVAAVTTVGLLVWLSFASRPPEGAAMVVDDTAAMDSGPMAQTVAAAEFGAAIASFEGREINLAGVVVSTVVNNEIFWIDVPQPNGSAPFVVRLIPGGMTTMPAAQTTVDVEGRVLAKTDSVLDAWQQAGIIADPNVRATLETGSFFIEAVAVRPGAGMN